MAPGAPLYVYNDPRLLVLVSLVVSELYRDRLTILF